MPPDDDGSGAPGPFQSLYRRFRPQRFSELRGQEHVALALRNAVREQRVAHAYLFSGPRGTGKTSTARILAKALNCTEESDGEPCGHCDSCRSITEGSSFDVHELDAASNNGVDAMRDLVARASLATPGRWKVYIVDEVHMLSVAASNALLKTLEEPPGHVVFVLATTDPHKVLPTIRSRTQHFEFHLLSEETLAGLLEEVSARAGLDLPPGALASAVRRGRGSARDALSVLDQVAAAGVVEEDVGRLHLIAQAIGDFDSEGAIVALDGAVRAGSDPQQLAIELIEHLRAGFLSLASGGALPDGTTTIPPEELEAVRALGLGRCVRALEVIGATLVAMRDSPEPRITLEVALIRLSHPEADNGPDALMERIGRIERRLEALSAADQLTRPTGGFAPAAPLAPAAEPPRAPVTAALAPSREPAVPEPPAPATDETEPGTAGDARSGGPETGGSGTSRRPALGAYAPPSAVEVPAPPPAVDTPERAATPVATADLRPTPAPAAAGPAPTRDELVLAWGDHVIQQLRPRVRMVFQIARFVGTEGEVALLALPNEGHLHHAQPLVGEVEAALGTHFGRPVALRLVIDPSTREPEPTDRVPATRPRSREATATPPGEPRPFDATGPFDDNDPLGDPDPFDIGSLDDLEVAASDEPQGPASTGVALATDRLLQAFPGAEEVDQP